MDRQISCANLSQADKFNTDAYIPRILNHLHRAKRNSAERRCRASHGEVVLLRHPWPELLGHAGRWGWQTWAQTHTHMGTHCSCQPQVAHRNALCGTRTPTLLQAHAELGTGRPLLSLAFKASCQMKLKDYAGITFPSVKRKDVSRMFNGLLKKEWPFFPLSGYALAFSESTPCTWVTTVSWQVTEPEWASNKTASRIYKY